MSAAEEAAEDIRACAKASAVIHMTGGQWHVAAMRPDSVLTAFVCLRDVKSEEGARRVADALTEAVWREAGAW
jgi:hypothetical protein